MDPQLMANGLEEFALYIILFCAITDQGNQAVNSFVSCMPIVPFWLIDVME